MWAKRLQHVFEVKSIKTTATVKALTLQTLGKLMESDPGKFRRAGGEGGGHTVTPRWLLEKCKETLEAGGALSATAGVLLAGALDATASALTQVARPYQIDHQLPVIA
eukprot:1180449-Prorocentrum_minimum.AAC.3